MLWPRHWLRGASLVLRDFVATAMRRDDLAERDRAEW